MSRKGKIVLGVVAASAVASVAWPVYAHCGKCAASGKDMVKLMEEGRLSLGKAVEIAEKHSNGKAVAAYCELEGDGLEIEVYCLVGNKIMEVEIDGKTGKVMEMEQKRSLPSRTAQGHAHEHAVPARTVEAGCATCIFNMEGVKGCKLAVKIDGKPYLVSGADVDAHGAGLCNSAKEAKVVGEIEGDKFVATSVELQPYKVWGVSRYNWTRRFMSVLVPG